MLGVCLRASGKSLIHLRPRLKQRWAVGGRSSRLCYLSPAIAAGGHMGTVVAGFSSGGLALGGPHYSGSAGTCGLAALAVAYNHVYCMRGALKFAASSARLPFVFTPWFSLCS